jgi:hypothetical protein
LPACRQAGYFLALRKGRREKKLFQICIIILQKTHDMKSQYADFENLRKLEESLWLSETRFDRAYMDRILAPDFFEFGRSGKKHSREDVLNTPVEEIRVEFPFENFEIHSLDPNIVLVTYISKVTYDELEVSNRSSLWSKTNGEWKLRFHQGTAVKT